MQIFLFSVAIIHPAVPMVASPPTQLREMSRPRLLQATQEALPDRRTGLNLPLYNWPTIDHLVALDLSPGMLSQVHHQDACNVSRCWQFDVSEVCVIGVAASQ